MTDTAATSPAEQDVHCPLCDYDLRGLTEARCPECGAPFDWDELRDPTRRKHPYLFEHHPERNLWSWFRTLIGGLLPRRFWKTLSPVQPSKPRRLLLYWILCLLAGSVGLFAELGRNYLSIYHAIGDNRTGMQRYFTGPVCRRLADWFVRRRRRSPRSQSNTGAYSSTSIRQCQNYFRPRYFGPRSVLAN